MAGNDLPDIIAFPGGLNVGGPSGTPLGTANLPQFLQTKCADLAPYLAGDAVKDYPNLAALPTFGWQNSGSAFGGHLYMVPVERYLPGQTLFKNTYFYDDEIGADYVPKNADDLKRVFQQLTRPKEGRYRHGVVPGPGILHPVLLRHVRSAQQLASRLERAADQELRNARVQRSGRLRA